MGREKGDSQERSRINEETTADEKGVFCRRVPGKEGKGMLLKNSIPLAE